MLYYLPYLSLLLIIIFVTLLIGCGCLDPKSKIDTGFDLNKWISS